MRNSLSAAGLNKCISFLSFHIKAAQKANAFVFFQISCLNVVLNFAAKVFSAPARHFERSPSMFPSSETQFEFSRQSPPFKKTQRDLYIELGAAERPGTARYDTAVKTIHNV